VGDGSEFCLSDHRWNPPGRLGRGGEGFPGIETRVANQKNTFESSQFERSSSTQYPRRFAESEDTFFKWMDNRNDAGEDDADWLISAATTALGVTTFSDEEDSVRSFYSYGQGETSLNLSADKKSVGSSSAPFSEIPLAKDTSKLSEVGLDALHPKSDPSFSNGYARKWGRRSGTGDESPTGSDQHEPPLSPIGAPLMRSRSTYTTPWLTVEHDYTSSASYFYGSASSTVTYEPEDRSRLRGFNLSPRQPTRIGPAGGLDFLVSPDHPWCDCPHSLDRIDDLCSSKGAVDVNVSDTCASISSFLDDHLHVNSSMGTSLPTEFLSNSYHNALSYSVSGASSEAHHASRSIMVRNVAPGVDDEILRRTLTSFGPLRELGAQQRSKGGRGSVTATFFDLRHARLAVKHLNGQALCGRRLDVRFCSAVEEAGILCEKYGASDFNQGTLVVFNVDSSTTAEEIRKVFGMYGDVKEIRSTPHKRHHKFVEFFDTRDAERAMKILNKTEINGKKVKIEISRPGGNRGFGSSGNSNSRADIITTFHNVTAEEDEREAPGKIGHSSALPKYNTSPTVRTSESIGEDKIHAGGGSSPSSSVTNPKFTLNISRVLSGEDTRTALMIRNIPNKYNQKMLLAVLEDHHRSQFDFFYLPIDFKNKCNVGYAFINFILPKFIAPFYEGFHRRKWGKFNSEKVCEITYARIQGKTNLISHFQNSSLMNEDPKCRPIIFGENGEQEEFPVGPHVRTRRGPSVREARVVDG